MAESTAQKGIIARVLHAFKFGRLKRSDGETVRDRKQAVAVALHEAGASDRESPDANRRNLAHTKAREAERPADGKARSDPKPAHPAAAHHAATPHAAGHHDPA